MGRFGEPIEIANGGAVPGLRRVVVHDRAVPAHRRRDHRRLHHPGVTACRATSTSPAEQLEADIRGGAIDTVIVAFGDHQGRLIGKRTDGEFYLDVVAERGHRELRLPHRLRPRRHADPRVPLGQLRAGLRRHARRRRPVDDPLPAVAASRTAVVLVDLVDVDDGAPVEVSPRRILQRQVEAAAELGLRLDDRQRGRVLPLPGAATTSPTPPATATSRRTRRALEDYNILQTTKEEDVLGRDPPRPARRRLPGRVLQGRGRAGPARAQPDVPAGAGDGRHQPRVQERGQGDRRPARSVGDVHGQAALRRRRLELPHPLQPVGRRRCAQRDAGRRRRTT